MTNPHEKPYKFREALHAATADWDQELRNMLYIGGSPEDILTARNNLGETMERLAKFTEMKEPLTPHAAALEALTVALQYDAAHVFMTVNLAVVPLVKRLVRLEQEVESLRAGSGSDTGSCSGSTNVEPEH